MRPSIREQIDKVSFEKEAVSETFDVGCWGKTGLFSHEMISLRDVMGCHI